MALIVTGMLLALSLLLELLAFPSNGEVYMVIMEGDPVSSYAEAFGAEEVDIGIGKSSSTKNIVELYKSRLVQQHDKFLQETFASSGAGYQKLYSYHHLINGFAVKLQDHQADTLKSAPGVMLVQKDWRVSKLTTHTPDFLGLPTGVWSQQGGAGNAGDGIVVGIIDTGIDPTHPSFSGQAFASNSSSNTSSGLKNFRGSCEVASFCNGKIVGARHFAAAATASGNFNASVDFDSPLDGDGHGSHTASIAAGNYNVPVTINGYSYGKASGMAPRARIAVYKALYRQFGGFVADVVAAIDKAVEDGVDVLNLSVGPNSPPSSSSATFLNVFDMAILAAVKQGVFVAQAAGNGGPYPRTIVSFSPWIATVAAGLDDRSYPNYISLGNAKTLPGVGLAPPTPGSSTYSMILAKDAVGNSSNYFFSPNDCQDPSLFNAQLVKGKVLICTFSFSFIFGGATVHQVAATVANLSAVGFVLVVESDLAGSKFEPVPISVPGIVITTSESSEELLRYYNSSTTRAANGKAASFNATAKIGNGQEAVFNSSAPQVALYSSRGPDVRNFAFQDADVLKPNILAPGSLIWGAWTPSGTDEPNFQGKNFALVSGTSMASPHVAGIAALLKKEFPGRSPAVIASAMMTTASTTDNRGSPLLAQHVNAAGGSRGSNATSTRNNGSKPSSSASSDLESATPFDYGHGAINPKAALDPGLVFDAGYGDYIKFLCAVPGVNATAIFNATRERCSQPAGLMSDLNLPSITISSLGGERRVPRTATSVGAKTEKYRVVVTNPAGVAVSVKPSAFAVDPGRSVSLGILVWARDSSEEFSFGEMRLVGDLGHTVRLPITVLRRQANSSS
ncbi:subtilisin-like protease SBT2.5 [Selaginella moellendorffii]|uniref:subtilisin-like protease SBT2.5 n=1 Tax=Selaginella moellendorffii TaxID=88036 RepID=UPI000D1CDCAC|nr:subtilisin-like protease SBT2.5 [Selaginella moellendorffii]|eukprot:XP_024538202.1 subtilisin-like protease SBT2.5 [Selaginella moellendorffii]